MELIPAQYYHYVYLIIVLILCIDQSRKLAAYPSTASLINEMQDTRHSAKVWCIFLAIFIGFRPLSEVFPDMLGYAEDYESGSALYDIVSMDGEPIWLLIKRICYKLGFPSTFWFAIITSLVITLQYLACRKWFGRQIYPAMLFMTTGFYYWSIMTVIIRSSLASALVLFAISLFMNNDKRSKLFALLLMGAALYTHTSSILISGCFLVSYYVVKDIRLCIAFWLVCLVASLFLGNYFEILFTSLGFDDRMSAYTSNVDYSGFAHSGFRWDFLIYSVVPIILGFFVTRRSTQDKVYSTLLNTYILCNAFWVLVIRAQFSDRFAGLSWLMYPIVIAYPLLKMDIWSNQPKIARTALLLHVGFIVGMTFIYYGLLR